MTLTALFLALMCLSLSGCRKQSAEKFTVSYWDSFDTQISITGYAQSRALFDTACDEAHNELLRLHALFDRYNAREGAHGVYELNAEGRLSGADDDLIALLQFCESLYDQTSRRVNPAMGALLKIWSDYREEGTRLPEMALLRAAAESMDPSGIQIDGEKREIRLAEGMQLDLGAVAKGYAVERVAALLEKSMPSYLIDAGGNIRVGDAPLDGRACWTVGVTDPAAMERGQSGIMTTLNVVNLSVVSSGGYQRYYRVDGARYHHIIDPDTLMPGGDFLQTTVLTRDSALADYLSTALFLMPCDRGRALVDSMDGVDAIWVMADETIQMTPGAQALTANGA